MIDSPYCGPAYCPHCLQPITVLLPVEPVYDLRLAAQLIPQTHEALQAYLKSHKDEFPRRYRLDKNRRRHRLLSASEIRNIRSHVLRFHDNTGKRRAMDAKGC